MLHAVIMAGGSGTRFWPQSRQRLPKQLLALAGERTMIQQTVDRCAGLVAPDDTWVVTNQLQADATAAQLPEVPSSHIIVEPCARNTAPCIGLAAVHALHEDPDATMLVMPADHVIQPVAAFQQAAQNALQLVEEAPERLVLFGVSPGFPATGFGYIERGEPLPGRSSAWNVRSFREKPDLQTAQQYVDSGKFYWNCGIFCWKAQTILQHLSRFEPDTWQRLQQIAATIGTDALQQTLQQHFPEMHSISIDFAVLEKANNVVVIEAPFTWDDVGSWQAVSRLLPADENGNTVQGAYVGIDAANNIIKSDNDHLIAALGVEDLIIVHTEDVTLVARRSESERVKELLEELKKRGDERYL